MYCTSKLFFVFAHSFSLPIDIHMGMLREHVALCTHFSESIILCGIFLTQFIFCTISCVYLFLTPNSRSGFFCARVSLNINSFLFFVETARTCFFLCGVLHSSIYHLSGRLEGSFPYARI